MNRRATRGLSRYLFIGGTISVIAVACLLVTIQSNHASETKEGKVNLATTSKIESPLIPPIDAAAPSIIETASFGLG